MHKTEIMRLIEVNKHSWCLGDVNYSVAYIHYWATFQLDFIENKIVIFVLSKFTDHQKSIHGLFEGTWIPG